MGHYPTVASAKSFLIINGFEISENVFGEFIYLNSNKNKLTLRIYKNSEGARIY